MANITLKALESLRMNAAGTAQEAMTGLVSDDSRLSDSRSPTSHTHGNITNAGAIGTTTDLPILTSDSGVLVAKAAGTASQYLNGVGAWSTPPDNNTVYTHPTTAGNIHIPAGGVSGNILRWTALGTAAWGADNNTDTNYYPTTFAWTAGTTAGPTGSLTGTGMTAVAYGAIPAASSTASGIITTGAQTFTGSKTFDASIYCPIIVTSLGGQVRVHSLNNGHNYRQVVNDAGSLLFQQQTDTSTQSTKLTLDASGNLTAANNVTANSDERVKTNWRGFGADFIAELAEVKSGIYDRTDVELTQVGVSAQSLQVVMPDAVITNEEGSLSVAYGNAALAACIELAKEVVMLRERIVALENK